VCRGLADSHGILRVVTDRERPWWLRLEGLRPSASTQDNTAGRGLNRLAPNLAPIPASQSRQEKLVLAGSLGCGVIAGLGWLAAGHPTTHAFRYATDLAVVGILVAVIPRKRRQIDTISRWAAPMFVLLSGLDLAAGVGLLWLGVHPTSRAVHDLVAGALGLTFFGGGRLFILWMRGPARSLSDEQVATLPPAVALARSAKVTIVLRDGRHLSAFVLAGRLLGGPHLTVSPKDVVEIIPASPPA
jgi:hypothetical protein